MNGRTACDFCGAMAAMRLCVVTGAQATVYDKDGKEPRAPAICDTCALQAITLTFQNAATRLATLESQPKTATVTPLRVVPSEGPTEDKSGEPPTE